MPSPEQVAEDIPRQLGRGPLPLRGLMEQPQRRQGLAVNTLPLEHHGELLGQDLDLGAPALSEEEDRFFEEGEGSIAEHFLLDKSLTCFG